MTNFNFRFHELTDLVECEGLIPLDLVKTILALPREPLIAELDRAARVIMQSDLEDSTWGDDSPLLHFLMLLGHLEAPEGFVLFMELMRKDDKWLDVHFGDYITEDISPMLGVRCGRFQLPVIQDFIMMKEPPEELWFMAPHMVTDLLAEIARHYPECKPETDLVVRTSLNYLSQVPDLNFNEFMIEVAASLTYYCCQHQLSDLLPVVERLYQQERIDEEIMGDWAEFQALFANPPKSYREKADVFGFYEKYNEQQRRWLLERIEIELEKSRKALKAVQDKRMELVKKMQMEKTGKTTISRNEPCPCGSGKKFKRCCGA